MSRYLSRSLQDLTSIHRTLSFNAVYHTAAQYYGPVFYLLNAHTGTRYGEELLQVFHSEPGPSGLTDTGCPLWSGHRGTPCPLRRTGQGIQGGLAIGLYLMLFPLPIVLSTESVCSQYLYNPM